MPRRRAPIAITIGVVGATRHRVLRLRGPLRRRALVRPARLPRACSPRSGSRASSCSSIGFLAMAVPVWASHPDRLPHPPGLREAQLAARPLPGGLRAAAPPRDVRHPGRARHLRRRLDVEPLGARAHLAEPHAVRHRPTRSSASTSASTSSSCRSTGRSSASPRPSCCSRCCSSSRRTTSTARIRVSGREVVISKSARIQIAVTAGLYLLLQARQHLARPVRDGHRDQHAHHRRRVHRRQRRDPRARDPRRDRRGRRRALLHHRVHRPLAPAARRHRAAHRVEPAHRLPLPVGHPALPGRPERPIARGAVHRAQHRPHPRRPTASTTSRRSRTRRRRTPSPARCAPTPRPRRTSASWTRS